MTRRRSVTDAARTAIRTAAGSRRGLAAELIRLTESFPPPPALHQRSTADERRHARDMLRRLRASADVLKWLRSDTGWQKLRGLTVRDRRPAWRDAEQQILETVHLLTVYERQFLGRGRGRRADPWLYSFAAFIGAVCHRHDVAISEYEHGLSARLFAAAFEAVGYHVGSSGRRRYLAHARAFVRAQIAPASGGIERVGS